MTSTLLSFIILTWNSEKYIHKCLLSIIEKCTEENINFEIIIVDNGSTDSSKEILNDFKNSYAEKINLIFLKQNRGTTYPRNLALKKSNGKFLIIADSDIHIQSGSISESLEYLEKHPDIGILAPTLILPTGEIQNSVKKFPTFFHKIEKTKRILIKKNSQNHDFYKNFPFSKITNVDTAISAFWIFRHTLLGKIGYLDEKIFYAPEDLDYCLRTWKSGQKITYYPTLRVLHNTQQITHKKPLGKIAFKHLIDLMYYYRKHGGWFSTRNICKNRNIIQ